MANRIESIVIGGHFEEFKAAETGIYPGMLLEMDSSGEVIKHNSEGGAIGDERIIALEDALQGRIVSTVYADNTTVFCLVCKKGDVVRFLCEAGTAIGIGDKLHSAGDGTLQEASAIGSGESIADVVAIAVEAVDLSASGAVDTLVAARIV